MKYSLVFFGTQCGCVVEGLKNGDSNDSTSESDGPSTSSDPQLDREEPRRMKSKPRLSQDDFVEKLLQHNDGLRAKAELWRQNVKSNKQLHEDCMKHLENVNNTLVGFQALMRQEIEKCMSETKSPESDTSEMHTACEKLQKLLSDLMVELPDIRVGSMVADTTLYPQNADVLKDVEEAILKPVDDELKAAVEELLQRMEHLYKDAAASLEILDENVTAVVGRSEERLQSITNYLGKHFDGEEEEDTGNMIVTGKNSSALRLHKDKEGGVL